MPGGHIAPQLIPHHSDSRQKSRPFDDAPGRDADPPVRMKGGPRYALFEPPKILQKLRSTALPMVRACASVSA